MTDAHSKLPRKGAELFGAWQRLQWMFSWESKRPWQFWKGKLSLLASLK